MSEQNILNPAVIGGLNPDYSVKITDPQVVARWQARSGKAFFRRLAARGKVFDMTWNKRLFADYQTLRAWAAQYENDYFTFADYDDSPTRYYTGMFADQPTFSRDANNQVTINAQFVEVPGLPMYQYPSNWASDSIFFEERGSNGVDLVKLTGSWDHGDKNYLLWSQDFENAAWAKGNATVTADVVTDPFGGTTADSVVFSITGGNAFLAQQITPLIPIAGRKFTMSWYLKAASGSPQIAISIQDQGGNVVAGNVLFALGTTWVRYTYTGTMLNTSTSIKVAIGNPNQTAIAYHLGGVQLECGGTMTTYTATTSSAVVLTAPAANSDHHGGSAYFDINNATDAAEWNYFGYGFLLWATKGPDMGMFAGYIDGVLEGSFDLYSATVAPSAVTAFGTPNMPLGLHRIKVMPTNSKNVGSLGYVVSADAIQVMR